MTYTNEELFPQYKKNEIPKSYIDTVIKGSGNIIEDSSRNTIVTGDNNYVGEETESITILNSSGCVVSSGVVGCVIIGSSGVVVSDNNLLYINNVLITSANTSSDGYRKSTTQYTIISLEDGTIDLQYNTSGGICYLPFPTGHNKKFTIKNNSPTFNDHEVWASGYTIDNSTSGGAGKVTLAYLESITVQSDGVSNYIII